MSWYSDGEPFDEYDPPYCETCRRTDLSYEVCERCVRTHNEEDEEDEEEEEDGDEDMTELDKLEAYLKENGYEYTRVDVDGESYTDVHQIVVYENGRRLWDAVCHSGSYGYSQGLLEIMVTDIAGDPGACIGWLTAQKVIDLLEGKNE